MMEPCAAMIGKCCPMVNHLRDTYIRDIVISHELIKDGILDARRKRSHWIEKSKMAGTMESKTAEAIVSRKTKTLRGPY
jgi:hypothetical protein